jgi:large subunit ribosomal protein L29
MAKTKNTMKDIRKMNDEDLAIEIRDVRRRLYDLRVQRVTEKVEDTSQLGKIRKNIARLLTEQTARRRKAGVKS